jgi:hypothetical protein
VRILRRVLWCIYAWPVTLLALVPSSSSHHILFWTVDLLVSIPALVALHLHIWDKRILTPSVWKAYAFIFVACDLAYNLVLEPAASHQRLDATAIVGGVILLPLYVAVFRYAFRRWDARIDDQMPAAGSTAAQVRPKITN